MTRSKLRVIYEDLKGNKVIFIASVINQKYRLRYDCDVLLTDYTVDAGRRHLPELGAARETNVTAYAYSVSC